MPTAVVELVAKAGLALGGCPAVFQVEGSHFLVGFSSSRRWVPRNCRHLVLIESQPQLIGPRHPDSVKVKRTKVKCCSENVLG
jgi:hypothetical protein